MGPSRGCADLLEIVSVLSLLVLVRVLASSSFVRRRCTMYQENPPAVIPSVRALLCYTGLLEAICAALALVLVRVIASSAMHKRALRTKEDYDSSEHSEYQQHKLDDEAVPKLMPSRHDIFLSYSGRQKGFVKDLYEMLHSMGYTAFFDNTHHSLPPGGILEAAGRCRLTVVVLSDDFVSSRWPMIELCAFVQAQSSSADQASGLKILPLFYKLSPSDLKLKQNLQKWRKNWKAFANHDINVKECERALHIVSRHRGVIFDPSGAEVGYMQNILSSISELVSPSIQLDTLDIEGEERLCKIILANFEELEHSMPSSPGLMPNAPSQAARVCVLGVYGLPGSGKSTLSKRLCNHYGGEFHGRVFYLELPTNPTHEQLVKISKNFLLKVTNFVDTVDRDIGQVYSLLEGHLRSVSVFLVVDNITRDPLTIEFVEHILRCNFRAGSKLLLVARTYSELHQLLVQGLYGRVTVPSINKREANQVLRQSAGSGRLLESCAPVEELDIRDQEMMEEAVMYMSGFGQPEYSPLVVKIMGSWLRDYGSLTNLDEWLNHMGSFWKRVQLSRVLLCKEEAVMQLVKGTFDKLPERLRFLFLDVALFILPSSYGSPLRILSLIHDRTPERIEIDMVDLQKHCFLENVEWEEIRIHDVFLEFAATSPGSCMYYLSSGHGGLGLPRKPPPPPDSAKICGLRAVVLEKYEGPERFEFWEGFRSVKALVLKQCSSVRVLGLPVGLKSLISLDIDDCPNLMSVQVGDEKRIIRSLRSFTWKNSVKRFFTSKNIMVPHKQQLNRSIATYAPRPALMNVRNFAFQMRWLQTLRLVNTGIKRLDNMGSYWPQLRDLEIVEECLVELEVGELLFLEDFSFNGDVSILSKLNPYILGILSCKESAIEDQVQRCPRRLKGKNLISGCTNLRNICIFNAAFEGGLGTLNSSQLNTLRLGRLWDEASLPDLSLSAHCLRTFNVWECRQLTNVSFMNSFDYLEELHIQSCPTLAEVCVGLDCLYRLRRLWIESCGKLQTLSGLSGLVRLERLHVLECVELRGMSGLSGLASLQELDVGRGCPELQILPSDLQGLTKLKSLRYYQRACRRGVLNLSNLLGLEHFYVLINKDAMDRGMLMGVENLASLKTLTIEPDKEVDVTSHEMDFGTLVDLATGLGVSHLSTGLGVSHLSTLVSIRAVRIQSVHNMASLSGIEFLLPLSSLKLENLHNLSCLQGIEKLIHLQDLTVRNCDSVEELPSLSLLVNMSQLTIEDCPKLRGVEGCDAMTNLRNVVLIGCESMERCPLTATMASGLDEWRVKGCKFASRDALAAQQHDEKASPNLHALVKALAMEL